MAGVAGLIIQQVQAFLASDDSARVRLVGERLRSVLASVSPAELALLLERMTTTGSDWEYHEPDRLARLLNHVLGEFVLHPSSLLEGSEHLEIARRQPVTFLVNHLSYADANALECLFVRAGFEEVAERLTVLAGPKVFTEPYRKLLSLCFGAIKTPQSSSRATGVAVMSKRDVASAAATTLRHVELRRELGDHLLIFVEGTRSRSASMQRALPAVSRYIENPGMVLIPVGIAGGERLVPIGEERLHETRVVARVGAPLAGNVLWERAGRKRRLVMDIVGLKIAELLSEDYRGVYGLAGGAELDEARRIAAEL